MKKNFRIIAGVFILILITSICFNIVLAVPETNPDPGSDQDPLVSQSYVDSLMAKYENEIKALREEIKTLKSDTGSQSKTLETVSVKAGQRIYAKSGTEIILKSGKAIAVKGKNGGLTDTTSAKELGNGAQISINHLLISPQDDGRGLKTSTNCWILVSGAYTIQGLSDEEIKNTEKENPPVKEDTAASTKGKVTASALNIRENANTTSKVVGKLTKDEVVTVLSKNGEWYKIKNSKGVTGWVLGKYIKT
ncbi:MAG: SH3 domain-containing protein [Clostridia bacterium]|nr:SH3 domain-containing protein [Clostridia bacterium]